MVAELPEAERIVDWSWHDDMIYGLHLVPPDADRQLWRSQLVLDIDHIVEWVQAGDRCRWRIAPATLVFDWVSELRINVDFTVGGLGNAVIEWSIDRIERVPVQDGRGGNFRWQVLLNVPQGGEIAFAAHVHKLTLRGEPQFFEEARLQDRPPFVLP